MHKKLPIDYIIESKSSLNLICFLVYNFNSPYKVRLIKTTNYSLHLKNKQYIDRTGKTLLEKLYSIFEDEKKNQEICLQIIEKLLKESHFHYKDILKDSSIDYVLKMKDVHYSTEILKLLIFYCKIGYNQDDLIKCKNTLAERSPLFEIILDLKNGTENSLQSLFDRYLNKMNILYKGYPNLLQTTLQKDRKYLLDYEIFSKRTFVKSGYIDREIPEDTELLDLNDNTIFTILSDKQHKLQNQIMNLTEPNQFEKILKKLDYDEVEILLLARSGENYENILEQMLKKPKNYVDVLLKQICSSYGMETFYTKKMLLMVFITV